MKLDKLMWNIEHDSAIKKMFQAVISLIPQIPALNTLMKAATQNGPLTIDFVSKSQAKTNGLYQERGHIYNGKKSIERFIKVVKEGQTFSRMFETLIFELCNAKNPNFQLFGKHALKMSDSSDRDAYALAVEFAEYSGTHKPAREILRTIFSNPKNVEAFRKKGLNISAHELRHLTSDPFRSFNDWWQHVNTHQAGKSFSHADIYRQDFDNKCKNVPKVPAKTPAAKVPVQPQRQAPQLKVLPNKGAQSQPKKQDAIFVTLWDTLRQGEMPFLRHGHGHKHIGHEGMAHRCRVK